MDSSAPKTKVGHRFRGFLPVVVDVETGGFNSRTDALLEIAAVILGVEEDGTLVRRQTVFAHVEPFPGANIEAAALEVNGIRIDNPLRLALPEREALDHVFRPIRKAVSENGCTRAILVGHNAHFDLGFVNAAVERTATKRCPFHPFSVFDTATLAGAALGQTVLARALQATGLGYDAEAAHSAIYDAESTADLYCLLVNRMRPLYDEFSQARNSPADP
ncbi:ribonuclease T [Sinimarinibacterium sp. CAU 1509]|uniref:ribonuclease T n=1 Tax=Sinimarinibacterium sp. CAU 1509 TaxID=2562283 RepID=UPI0010AC2CD2|nr:ribonuclease T [Sinimarinibacterium sp. CAU 1509]TJY65131.1 ribonuclease T [Sinimarinibacterium sp. CAU 1509]